MNPTPAATNLQRALPQIHQVNLLMVFGLVGSALYQKSLPAAPLGGMALGASLMLVNLWLLGWGVGRLLSRQAGVGVALFLASKTLFLALAVFLLLHYLAANPLGLMAGMVATLAVSTLVLLKVLLVK